TRTSDVRLPGELVAASLDQAGRPPGETPDRPQKRKVGSSTLPLTTSFEQQERPERLIVRGFWFSLTATWEAPEGFHLKGRGKRPRLPARLEIDLWQALSQRRRCVSTCGSQAELTNATSFKITGQTVS
ncbi:hypothetical protein AB0J43_23710, partial [Nonomuraea fuscirosea]